MSSFCWLLWYDGGDDMTRRNRRHMLSSAKIAKPGGDITSCTHDADRGIGDKIPLAHHHVSILSVRQTQRAYSIQADRLSISMKNA